MANLSSLTSVGIIPPTVLLSLIRWPVKESNCTKVGAWRSEGLDTNNGVVTKYLMLRVGLVILSSLKLIPPLALVAWQLSFPNQAGFQNNYAH